MLPPLLIMLLLLLLLPVVLGLNAMHWQGLKVLARGCGFPVTQVTGWLMLSAFAANWDLTKDACLWRGCKALVCV